MIPLKTDLVLDVKSKKYNNLKWDNLSLIFMVGQMKFDQRTNEDPAGQYLYCVKGEANLEDIFYLAHEMMAHLETHMRGFGDKRDILEVVKKMRETTLVTKKNGQETLVFGDSSNVPVKNRN